MSLTKEQQPMDTIQWTLSNGHNSMDTIHWTVSRLDEGDVKIDFVIKL